MSDDFTLKRLRPWPNERLRIAAIVGHTTATSTRLWLRTAAPGDYTLLLWVEGEIDDGVIDRLLGVLPVDLAFVTALPGIGSRTFTIRDYDHDTTHTIDIQGLAPGCTYRYALVGSYYGLAEVQALLGHDRPHRVRTLPASMGAFAFAFTSCHMPYEEGWFGKTRVVNDAMWEYLGAVLDRRGAGAPDVTAPIRFIVGGGDQVYVDGVDTLNIWKKLGEVMRCEDGALLPAEEDMVSWYRDIYRGYWGFVSLRDIYANWPQLMIWDDHELGDGWGSHILRDDGRGDDELDELLPNWRRQLGDRRLAVALLERMRRAAHRVYVEYVHSHNPPTDGHYDYAFTAGCAAFYVLDGRGERDVNRERARILGDDQWARFERWLGALDPVIHPFVFVVSAVPVIHLTPAVIACADRKIADAADLADDLRDSWEHPLHDEERRRLLRALFGKAKAHRICVLSGDVHVAAAFRLVDRADGCTPGDGAVIYQLTSSAITYNLARPLAWGLRRVTRSEGEVTADHYAYKRLACYTDSNFAVIEVHPDRGVVEFQLFGESCVDHPDKDNPASEPILEPITTLELDFRQV